MTEGEKIEKLIQALNDINKTIYANNIRLGSTEYFKIRNLCTDTIEDCGGRVE